MPWWERRYIASRQLTKRQCGCGVITTAGITLAGCLGNDDDEEVADDTDDKGNESDESDTDDSADLDDLDTIVIDDDEKDEPSIAIALENEDGEPIESGVTVEIEHENGTVNFMFNLDEMDDAEKEGGTLLSNRSRNQVPTISSPRVTKTSLTTSKKPSISTRSTSITQRRSI